MNALPMLTTCFTRQWAGLDPSERARLTEAWDMARLPSASILKSYATPQQEQPLWTVAYSLGSSMALLSVKQDVVMP